MQNTKQIQAFYKQNMYRGRSTFARIFDFISLRLMIFAVFYIWFYFNVHNQILTIILALICAGIFSILAELYKSIRMESYVCMFNIKLERKYMLEQLTMLPADQYYAIVCQYAGSIEGIELENRVEGTYNESPMIIYALQSIEPVRPSQIIEAYRLAKKHKKRYVFVFSTSEFTTDAETLSKRPKDVDIKLMPPETLIDFARACGMIEHIPIENIIREEIENAKSKRQQMLKHPFVAGKVKNYLICAAVLIAASYITGYRVYYPILAAVCVCLAIISWWLNSKFATKTSSTKQENI